MINKYFLLLFVFLLFGCKKTYLVGTSASISCVVYNILNNNKIHIDSIFISNSNDEDFKSFYKKYNYETVWNDKQVRESIIEEFENAPNEGLESNDYNYKILKTFENQFENLPDSTIIKYDILLTLSAQKFINHNKKGKLNPKELYSDWDLVNKKIDVNSILIDFIEHNSKKVIEQCKPNHSVYLKLKSCLKILKQFPEETNFTLINLNERILINQKNNNIPIIKKKLMYWGDLKEKDTTLTVIYDKKTQEALKKFQARHGLKADGVIGKSTIEALNFTRNQRIEQVIVNMERWRWFANDFGKNYLLINIPDYHIVAVKEQDTLQYQKVVVGKESRRTPILESKISTINLNPNWTVPPTILKEDIFPEAEKDRNVFRQKGLIILDKKNNEVNPWLWKKEDANKYKYVQNPSRNNSLGSMKINFPNKHSVYLHDTNHRDYFSITNRSLSSGCVRLEKPLEMAAYILNDTANWSLKRIQDTTSIGYYNKLLKKRRKEIDKKNAKIKAKNHAFVIKETTFSKPELKTIIIKVTEDIFIHQLYWTAWETNGVLNFREDIYCLDADLYSKLRY